MENHDYETWPAEHTIEEALAGLETFRSYIRTMKATYDNLEAENCVLKDEIVNNDKLLAALIECIDSAETGGVPYRGEIARVYGKRIVEEITGESWEEVKDGARLHPESD